MHDTDTVTAAPVTDSDLAEVRNLIEDALRVYTHTSRGQARLAAGVSAEDLADNVKRWTHTTRLRDFVEGVRTENV